MTLIFDCYGFSEKYLGSILVAQTVNNQPPMQETQVQSQGLGRSPGEGRGNPLLIFMPGEFHGQRSMVENSVIAIQTC